MHVSEEKAKREQKAKPLGSEFPASQEDQEWFMLPGL
jgi:hypothetical protein